MLTNVTVCDMLSDWKVDFARKGGDKLSEVKFDPERLKAAMKAMRPPMGDTKLAEVAGISRQMVFYLKKGKRNSVSAEILGKIAQALKINVTDLMSGQDESEKLPEPVRQLAQIASNLSEVRREELLRIAAALEKLEREQADHPLPAASMGASLKIIEELRRNGADLDALDSLEALLRGTPPGEATEEDDELDQNE